MGYSKADVKEVLDEIQVLTGYAVTDEVVELAFRRVRDRSKIPQSPEVASEPTGEVSTPAEEISEPVEEAPAELVSEPEVVDLGEE